MQRSSTRERAYRNRWLGQAIQASAAVGVALSVAGIVLVPIFALRVVRWIDGVLLTISRDSDLAAASMQEVALVLDEGSLALGAAQSSMHRAQGSLLETRPLIHATAELVGEQAPVIITDTRSALASAVQGAAAIDRVLRTLAVLGPLTGVTYAPERPLDEGLSGVASSLEPLPAALREVGDELEQAASGLETIGSSLEQVSAEMGNFADDIAGKSAVFSDLAHDLEDLAGQAEAARAGSRPVVWIVAAALELLLVGQALGQLAIYQVGRSMIPV